MKSQFGKCENVVIKCWSQTIYSEFSLPAMHDFGLLDIQKKFQLWFFRSRHRKSTWQRYPRSIWILPVDDKKLLKTVKKLVRVLLTQSCVKFVGSPTQTSLTPFFRLSKTRFPDISCPLGGFCPLENFYGIFLEAPRRAEKHVLFSSTLAGALFYRENSIRAKPTSTTARIRPKQEHPLMPYVHALSSCTL